MEATESEVRSAGGAGYAGRIFSEIQGVIDDTGGQAGALIRVLQQAQGLIGYLPVPVLKTISPQERAHTPDRSQACGSARDDGALREYQRDSSSSKRPTLLAPPSKNTRKRATTPLRSGR